MKATYQQKDLLHHSFLLSSLGRAFEYITIIIIIANTPWWLAALQMMLQSASELVDSVGYVLFQTSPVNRVQK